MPILMVILLILPILLFLAAVVIGIVTKQAYSYYLFFASILIGYLLLVFSLGELGFRRPVNELLIQIYRPMLITALLMIAGPFALSAGIITADRFTRNKTK